MSPWWGILAPSQIDPAITKQINADVNEILNSDSLKSFLEAQGAEPPATSPEQFSEMLKTDVAKWAKIIQAADGHLNWWSGFDVRYLPAASPLCERQIQSSTSINNLLVVL